MFLSVVLLTKGKWWKQLWVCRVLGLPSAIMATYYQDVANEISQIACADRILAEGIEKWKEKVRVGKRGSNICIFLERKLMFKIYLVQTKCAQVVRFCTRKV